MTTRPVRPAPAQERSTSQKLTCPRTTTRRAGSAAWLEGDTEVVRQRLFLPWVEAETGGDERNGSLISVPGAANARAASSRTAWVFARGSARRAAGVRRERAAVRGVIAASTASKEGPRLASTGVTCQAVAKKVLGGRMTSVAWPHAGGGQRQVHLRMRSAWSWGTQTCSASAASSCSTSAPASNDVGQRSSKASTRPSCHRLMQLEVDQGTGRSSVPGPAVVADDLVDAFRSDAPFTPVPDVILDHLLEGAGCGRSPRRRRRFPRFHAASYSAASSGNGGLTMRRSHPVARSTAAAPSTRLDEEGLVLRLAATSFSTMMATAAPPMTR